MAVKNKSFGRKLTKNFCVLLLAAVSVVGMFGCSKGDPAASGNGQDSTPPEVIVEAPKASSADLYCLEFSTFSGNYVEDGKNEKVENVATILVENRSDVFLDRATVKYKYGDKTATFLVTGLPARAKCWVMEANKLRPDGKHTFEFEDCTSAFKEDAVLLTDKLLVETDDNKVKIKNISDKLLKNVCIYYKNKTDDGSFLGGITYMMTFGDLNPGDDLEKASGHYGENSMIVRYSFQE